MGKRLVKQTELQGICKQWPQELYWSVPCSSLLYSKWWFSCRCQFPAWATEVEFQEMLRRRHKQGSKMSILVLELTYSNGGSSASKAVGLREYPCRSLVSSTPRKSFFLVFNGATTGMHTEVQVSAPVPIKVTIPLTSMWIMSMSGVEGFNLKQPFVPVRPVDQRF